MIGTLHTFVLDCPDPEQLAEFYRSLLGGRIVPDTDGDDDWVDLILSDSGPRLAFQGSPGYRAPIWPGDDGDQQAHLDIRVADLAEAHEEVIASGATLVEEHPTFRVYLGPVGHPFCTVS